MFTTLASSYGRANVSQNADGSYTEQVYNPVDDRGFGTRTSDLVKQQNGVPKWIQDTLGIKASSMSAEDLAKLNTDYSINRTRQDRNVNRVLSDKTGKVLGTNTYYDAPFSLVNDVILPAAMVWGGGYLGANALFGGAGAGAAAGGASGASSGATNAALIDSAAGTAGYGASSAGAGGAAAGGLAGTGIPEFSQLPGYGNNVATLADASGASPFTSGAASGVDPITGYLTTGASEGSTIGNALTGAGGAAGAVGSGTTAGTLGSIGGAVSALGNVLGGNTNWLNLGGNLLNSYLGARATGRAVDAQLQAGRESNALLEKIYGQTRTDNLPALEARNAGLAGYRNLLANPGKITSDPGYQFGLQQGINAYDNSGAARGMRLSGAQAKALTRFGQDYGSTKYNEALNRYGNLAGLGGTGAQTIANTGTQLGSQGANNITGMGNAAASGYIGGANAISGGISNFLNQYNQNNLLRQLGIGG